MREVRAVRGPFLPLCFTVTFLKSDSYCALCHIAYMLFMYLINGLWTLLKAPLYLLLNPHDSPLQTTPNFDVFIGEGRGPDG